MSKQIVVIGGGISGLSVLHFLRQKFPDRETVNITLLEKGEAAGGTIRSIRKNGCLFETGPNGFLNSKQRTLEFVEALGLNASLVKADQESKIRYLSVADKLHELPAGPKDFLSFGLFNPIEKIRILAEPLVFSKSNPKETVYEFGRRRFGRKFSEVMLDPMVSGIFGGDARTANLQSVFPRIYELESEYGSLFKAMMKLRKAGQNGKGAAGRPKGELMSFQGGVEELIGALGRKYEQDIRLGYEAIKVLADDCRYHVHCANGQEFSADELFICAPAYCAGPMIKGVNQRLANGLSRIHYAPMAVVGLVYPKSRFEVKPRGYGYLIPSSEQSRVLGVLFESNIFPGRCPDDQILFRVMIGGERNPDILTLPKEQLIQLAKDEIGKIFPRDDACEPMDTFFVPWKRAIPQYNRAYCDVKAMINEELMANPTMHLVANYLNGVSMNDCIENAFQGAQGAELN